MLHPAPLARRPHPVRQAPRCLARHRAFVSRFAAAGVARARTQVLSPVLLRRRGVAARAGSAWFCASWTCIVAPRLVGHTAPARSVLRLSSVLLRERTAWRPAPAVPQPGRELVQRHAHARVERSVVRHEQPVHSSSVRVLRTTRIEHQAAYPRVTVVLSRPVPPVAAPAAERTPPAMPPAQRRPAAAPAPLLASVAREPLPPHELARVTDHVLAQLDRKVLSYRERHGQI